MFQENDDFKHKKDFKRKYHLHDNLLYRLLQLTHVIPRNWKDIVKQNLGIGQG